MSPKYAHGKICYLQIPTTDIERSVAFYQKVCGWKTRTRGDGSMAFDDGVGEVSGAWVTGRPSSPTPGLLLFIMVDDVAASSKIVEASGGRIVTALDKNAPEWFALFADPDGNVLGLYQERPR
ncbi:MAG TPA: VOC family protein [Candidatus Krumholzibacteria bacterium]|nr:VOC family protein [Candidatus Krumholzibacteria bacterium]